MAASLFRSPLAPRLEAFLETRRVGRRGVSTQKLLRYLDRFLARELKPGQTITREVAERWMESIQHLSTGSRINRISVLRQFCRYLSYFHPHTYTVPQSSLPRRTRLAPHIYTRGDVCKIMAAARRLGPAASLRPMVVSHLIGLLYATGIRIGEALNLTLADLDLKRRLLLIREGKFGKSRYIPLSASTASRLAAYVEQRRKAKHSTASTAPLFVNLAGRKYGHSSWATIFLEVVRQIGLRGPKGQRGPRVHDFRHTQGRSKLPETGLKQRAFLQILL